MATKKSPVKKEKAAASPAVSALPANQNIVILTILFVGLAVIIVTLVAVGFFGGKRVDYNVADTVSTTTKATSSRTYFSAGVRN